MKRAFAVCLLCAAGYGCGSREPVLAEKEAAVAPAGNPGEITLPADSPKLKQLKIEKVGSAEVPADQVTSPGKIEANPNKLSHVVLPVAGRIAQVFVKIGDAVQQGQVLLTVESPDVDAALSGLLQAQASVTQARAVLTKSQADYERAKDLFENNAIAKKEVLNEEAALAQSKASLDQALASEQQAKRRLEILGIKAGELGQHVAVHAPIAGKVLEMSVVPGEFRNDTEPAGHDHRRPQYRVGLLRCARIVHPLDRPGRTRGYRTERLSGRTFRGRVTRIADMVDPQTRTVKVHAEMDNRAAGCGRRCSAPSTTTIRRAWCRWSRRRRSCKARTSRWCSWRCGPGRFKQVYVKLGERMGDMFAVLQGLPPGSRVVVDGAMLLKGTRNHGTLE